MASIWNCKRSVAKTLLMHYMWDKEKLLSDYADRGPEHVFKVAGVAMPREGDAGPGGCRDGRMGLWLCVLLAVRDGCCRMQLGVLSGTHMRSL